MAKRRKYKRTARRGGRVMTVTTSSRVVKTTRMNPDGDMIAGSKRIAEMMSPWHSSGSDAIYAVSSHWYGGHAVARSAVEGALANIERDVAIAETVIGRERNGWTKADLRSLKTMRNYLRKALQQRSNPHDPRTAETVRIPAVIRATLPASSGDPRRAETRRLRVVRVAAARSNPSQGGGYWVLRKETGSGPRYLAGRSNEMTRDAAKAMKFLSKMGAQSYCRDFGHSREGYRTVQLPATNPGLALRLSRATWRRLPKGDRRARGSVRFVRCKTSKRGAAHWLRCVVR